MSDALQGTMSDHNSKLKIQKIDITMYSCLKCKKQYVSKGEATRCYDKHDCKHTYKDIYSICIGANDILYIDVKCGLCGEIKSDIMINESEIKQHQIRKIFDILK